MNLIFCLFFRLIDAGIVVAVAVDRAAVPHRLVLHERRHLSVFRGGR